MKVAKLLAIADVEDFHVVDEHSVLAEPARMGLSQRPASRSAAVANSLPKEGCYACDHRWSRR